MMENKVTFSSSDLPQGSNTLSLLQEVECLLKSGKTVFYNFLHLSMQEVLSAYYITTKLSDSEQVSQFQQLFSQPRFAAVFQFYAAITKLKSPGICQVIDRIVEAKSKPLIVSLLRCLHEAQDPALCLYIAKRLGYELNLKDTPLSLLDCLSIIFFLSSLTGKETSVNLDWCTIDDLGANYLSKYLAEGGVSGAIRWPSLEVQLSKFPAHLLDVGCADAHLVQLTECFSEWQTHLSTSLQLTAVEVEDIERAWPRHPAMQRVEMFRRWKGKSSSQATYR
jgi:hypothetical protein